VQSAISTIAKANRLVDFRIGFLRNNDPGRRCRGRNKFYITLIERRAAELRQGVALKAADSDKKLITAMLVNIGVLSQSLYFSPTGVRRRFGHQD
jgi:hypothetical protein